MATPAHTTHVWRFGVFEVDAQRQDLRRAGIPVSLREQSFRILVLLLEHAGELVTREDLHKTLWSADTYVDFDHSLNSAVMKLREALGDTADRPLYIETIPRRGYRFIAPLAQPMEEHSLTRPIDVSCATASLIETARLPAVLEPPSQIFRHGVWRLSPRIATSMAIFVMACVPTIWYLRRPLPPPRITDTRRLTNDARWNEKFVRGTDGNRVYLSLYPQAFGQVPVSGGQITTIPIRIPNFLPAAILETGWLGFVSPDGSSVLIHGEYDPKDGMADLWVAGTSEPTLRYLTRGNPGGYAAGWSQDGTEVIFGRPDGKIYTIPVSGGEPRLVRDLGTPDYTNYFAYSPDGGRIRFSRGYHHNDATLWQMSADGSNLHELLPQWNITHEKCCGMWTPDGEFFIFLSARLRVEQGVTGFEIWAIDERRGHLRRVSSSPVQLTFGPTKWTTPIPSRDGRSIFASGATYGGQLLRYNRKTQQLQPYLGGRSAEMLDFSRDGKYVTYTSFPDGVLWRANRDGTDAQQLVRPQTYAVNARWSPDGSRIAFVDFTPQQSKNAGSMFVVPSSIFVVPSQGGTPVRILPDDEDYEKDPTWSPDGKQIAFWSPSANGESKDEMRIVDLATKSITRLPSAPTRGWRPRWSPDGRYILWMTNPYPGNNDGVELYDLKTRKWRVLLTGIGGSWPCWSRDSRFIYMADVEGDRAAVIRISVAGGSVERVLELADFQSTGYLGDWSGLDPDDNLLFLRDEGANEIYALTLDR